MFRWSQGMGIALCREIEKVAPAYGAHVALTGGLLYRDGGRKDCDILVYRIRQVEGIDWSGLFEALRPLGVVLVNDYGWCKKAKYLGMDVDLFDPEASGEYGAYGTDEFEPVV